LQGLAVYAGIVDNTGGFNVVGPLTITATSSAITVSYAGPQMALTLQANQHYTIGIHLGPIAAATSTPAPTSTPTPTPAPTATPTPTPAPTPTPTATPFAAPSVAALYNLSNANVFVNGHTGSVASDGTNIWLTTSDNSFSYVTKMTVDGTATNYTVNTGSQNADKGNTIAIAHGPDGNMWFTDVNDSQSWSIVGKVTPEGTVTRYTVDSFGTTIDGIAAGPDGNLWFTEATKIGKITTSGTATFYTMPDTLDTPHRIIAGPDGNLWFTETGKGDRIGKITTSGTITEYTIHDATSDTSGDGTDGIAVGSDGNLWVVEAGLCKVAKVNPSTGNATEYAVGCGPNATPLQDIASGPNGIMWVTGPGWGVQFTPGNLFAVSTADGSVISGGALPGYLQPAVFASDSEGRLFFDPSGDYWIAGSTALMQIAP
jgi:streptogramin lyase